MSSADPTVVYVLISTHLLVYIIIIGLVLSSEYTENLYLLVYHTVINIIVIINMATP